MTAYLMWYDDNPKVPLRTKIEAAVDAYNRRFKAMPNVVLVHEEEVVTCNTVIVQGVNFVRRNNFWVGYQREA